MSTPLIFVQEKVAIGWEYAGKFDEIGLFILIPVFGSTLHLGRIVGGEIFEKKSSQLRELYRKLFSEAIEKC